MKTLNQLIMGVTMVFSLLSHAEEKQILNSTNSTNEIQRLRLDFVSPLGYTRHLLLGFTPDNAASDDVDYGYDALNIENWPDDLNWRIGDDNYIIQGVGEFNVSKVYPFRMFLSNEGSVEFVLNSLENFNSDIDVYIYDSLLGTFSGINSNSFTINMPTGEHINRFFITFTNQYNVISNSIDSYQAQLSIPEHALNKPQIQYYYQNQELTVSSENTITGVHIYDLSGKVFYAIEPKKNNLTISLIDFNMASSVYIVKVQTQQGNFYKKFFVDKRFN